MIKYKKNFNLDWEFYTNNRHKFTFYGDSYIPSFIFNENGCSAKEAFFIYDSKGKIVPCNDIELLIENYRAKCSINFQLKEWKENYDNCLIGYVKSRIVLNNEL